MGCLSSVESQGLANPSSSKMELSTSLSLTTGYMNEVEIDMSHFTKPKELLGVGGFGIVRRIIKLSGPDLGYIYAMKSMSKATILGRHSGTTAVMNELKSLILLGGGPHICKLHYAFQDSTHLYMMLDYAAGGDMRYNLRRASMYRLDESLARIFIRQVLEALDYCHHHSVLHRGKKKIVTLHLFS